MTTIQTALARIDAFTRQTLVDISRGDASLNGHPTADTFASLTDAGLIRLGSGAYLLTPLGRDVVASLHAPRKLVTYCDVSDSLYPRTVAEIDRTHRLAYFSGRGNVWAGERAAAAVAIRAARARGAKLTIGVWTMTGIGWCYSNPTWRRLGRERKAPAMA